MITDWGENFDSAITVCDTEGVILDMNEKAAATFAKDGGKNLIGTNLMDCHPPLAQQKIRELLQTQQKNVYTIEKNGVKKMIYQAPWYKGSEFAGLVEISHVIPTDMPHFVRKS